MYSLEQLKVFVSVCETGSLSATARALGRAQSGISQMIANLEVELDQTLFTREKTGMHLTAAGQALLPEARALLRQNHLFEQRLQALARNHSHHLSVAVEIGVWSSEIAGIIAQLDQTFPHLQITLRTASTFDIEHMLETGEVQLGVLYQDNTLHAHMDAVFLGYNRFVTVVSPEHPLAKMKHLNAKTLTQYRQIVQRSLSGKEMTSGSAIASDVWYVNEHYALTEMALHGAGWVNVPERIALPQLQAGRLVRLHLSFEPDGNLIPVLAVRSSAHSATLASEKLIADLQMLFRHFQAA